MKAGYSLIIALSLVLVASQATAVPAKRGITRTLTLADGTTVEATLAGDEYAHYYVTADGRLLVADDTSLTDEGTLLTADGEEGVYRYVSQDSLLARRQARARASNARRMVRASAQQRSTSYRGSRKGLVVLVNFSNLEMVTTQQDWDAFFNQEGYNVNGMQGSVHDYFLEQSYGAFDLTFDVVGPVTVSHPYSYYGSGDESNVPSMVSDACKLVDSDVDFSVYDWDGDGYVDQVFVIYAGYGESQGASESTIWPHEWQLSGNVSTLKLDGVTIDTYACSCELYGSGKAGMAVVMDGIGTACHEFSHCLGLPDFYDTSSSGSNYGMDVWSVLDYGSYNADGYVPAAFTAYERNFCGWLDLTELSSATHVSDMPCLTDEAVAYIVRNDNNSNEYYILQNIQQTGFNTSAYGHGLLVQHVDYDATAWSNNAVNTSASHQRMTIFAADNTYGQYGRNANGDPFPGTSGNTSLTNTSSPSSTLYNSNTDGQKLMSKPIENIDETMGLISFDFMGGSPSIGTPTATEATDIVLNGCSFTANWTAVSGATGYEVLLSPVVDESDPWNNLLLEEDFAPCFTDDYGTTDISSTLDTYLSSSTTTGWTGQNLYTSPYGLRIGSGSKRGYIMTPGVNVPMGDDVTFIFTVNFGDAGKGEGEVFVSTASGISTYSPFSGSQAGSLLSGISDWTYGNFYMGLYSVSELYLEALYIFDGDYSWDDFTSSTATSPPSRSSKGLTLGGMSLASSPSLSLTPGGASTAFSSPSQSSTSGDVATASTTSTTANVNTLVSTTSTSYTFTRLSPAVYSYKVRALTSGGTGAWSNSVEVDLSEGTSAIVGIGAGQGQAYEGRVYDLSGRPVSQPTHGLYIRDGKKYMVK